MKDFRTLFFLFIILLVYSCGNSLERNTESKPEQSYMDTIIPTFAGNQHFDPPELLPDSLQKIVKSGRYILKNGFDSLAVSKSTWIYSIDAYNKHDVLLLVEGVGDGIAGGEITLSVIKNVAGKQFKVQSLSAIPDSLKRTVTNGVYDIALYYQNALFDAMCPVSINYKWNGHYYDPAELNYVVSVDNIVYTSDLLKLMGIVAKQGILPVFPFIKTENLNDKYNINRIDIDTLKSKDDKIFLFKNDCSDEKYANHIWIIKKVKKEYILLAEQDRTEATAIFLIPGKSNALPDIVFGMDTLRWNGQTYRRTF